MSVTIDLMEYSSDALAQAAYVTNAAETLDQSNTTTNTALTLGNRSGVEYRRAQAFQLSENLIVTAIEVLRGTGTSGTPTGNWTLRIETNDAGDPSGTLADTGASIVVTPPAESASVKGTFANSFLLNGATSYWLVIQCDNQSTDDAWTTLSNNTSVYADGVLSTSTDGVWAASATYDLWFKVYTQALQCYSESTIKEQGSYSLKALAAKTDSLNDTLTRTIGSPIDLSTQDIIKMDIRASRTGENIEAKFADSDVKLVLNFEGDDAATSTTDGSLTPHTMSFEANAQIDTAQYKYGSSSLLLDGTGDYIHTPASSDFNFGTGNFTIDFWVRFNSYINYQGVVSNSDDLSANNGFWLEFGTGRGFTMYYDTSLLLEDNDVDISGLSTNTWYHFAVVRSGTDLKLYKDGTLAGHATDSSNITSTNALLIGKISVDAVAYWFDGWIDELRITKGRALWTANFTKPAVAPQSVINHIIDIDSADTFQTEDIDIADIANIDKENIDTVQFKIINADA